MISVPPNIQYQLGEAVGVIADSDFWERWDTLVDVRLEALLLRFRSTKDWAGSGLSTDTGQYQNE